MTEDEWLDCTDPQLMLEFMRGRISDRKWRLFACACCRHIWHLILDERGTTAADTAERYVDGQATDDDLRVVWQAAWADDLPDDSPLQSSLLAAVNTGYFACHQRKWLHRAASSASDAVFYKVFGTTSDESRAFDAEEAESNVQCSFVRDIFGNPFRPVTINPEWLTPAVVALAQTIYDERAFDRLPELADALVDAGCDSQDILNHCRTERPHVRGCWAVDLVLGKE